MRVERARNVETPAKERAGQEDETVGIQRVFKNICGVLFVILVLCVPGFLKFRHYCQAKGYYVFASDSFVWCGLGFFLIFAAKYGYIYLMDKPIEKVINPAYDPETREVKKQFMLKLSYDTIFYTIATFCSYFTFRQEYWFPSSVGGCGACSQIYKEYPDWPQGKKTELEIYFCFQLGVHIFSIFELVVLKKNYPKKYYQYMLHHFVAASLILFSMMSNQITAGLMILIVHDASDIFMAAGRCYTEANIPKSKAVTSFLMFNLLFSWIYLRIIIFPFCLLSNVYINKPLPRDEWYIIHWEYIYLLSMAFVLFGMHLYWTYCIIKSLIISLNKNKFVNAFDSEKKK